MSNPKVSQLVALATLALLTVPFAAQASEVPIDLQVAIVLKALAYDPNLESRLPRGASLRVGVLYADGHSASQTMAKQIADALVGPPERLLKDHKLEAHPLPYHDAAGLRAALVTGEYRMLWVCTGLKDNLETVQTTAAALQVLTVGSQLAYVEEGLAMGVFVVGDRPKIVINKAAALAQGSEFGSELLQIARVLN